MAPSSSVRPVPVPRAPSPRDTAWLEEFEEHLRLERNRSSQTVRAYLADLRALIDHVAGTAGTSGSPAADDAAVRGTPSAPDVPAELSALDVDDIEAGRGVVRLTGKGDRQRTVPYGAPAGRALQVWQRLGRPRLARPDSGPALFLGARGGRLGVRQARTVVDRALEGLGDTAARGPHALRHTAATHLLDRGTRVRRVARPAQRFDGGIDRTPPFEAPHHSACGAALVVGGNGLAGPGAASLTNGGVVFRTRSGARKAHHEAVWPGSLLPTTAW